MAPRNRWRFMLSGMLVAGVVVGLVGAARWQPSRDDSARVTTQPAQLTNDGMNDPVDRSVVYEQGHSGTRKLTQEARDHHCFAELVDSAQQALSTLQNPGDSLRISHRDTVFLRDCRRSYQAMIEVRDAMDDVARLNLTIPEFHDEQRFRLTSTSFGPVVKIFASPNLSGFRHRDQLQAHGNVGVLAAVVHVESGTAPLGAEYTDLGLGYGVNCLWVGWRPGTSTGGQWFARMGRADAVDRTCHRNTAGVPLAVDRQALNNFAFDSIPPVARIGLEADGRPYFGVKCLAGWCNIGRVGFMPHSIAKTLSAPRASPSGKRVEGWHDEQILAEFENGVAVPGTIRAALLPTATHFRSELQLRAPGGVHFAVLFLDKEPATNSRYKQWGLHAGQNHLFLRWVPPTNAAGAPSAGRFQMWVGSPGLPSSTLWTHVERHAHFDAAVVPTARFRWVSTDDGVWFGCGQTCCRGDGMI